MKPKVKITKKFIQGGGYISGWVYRPTKGWLRVKPLFDITKSKCPKFASLIYLNMRRSA